MLFARPVLASVVALTISALLASCSPDAEPRPEPPAETSADSSPTDASSGPAPKQSAALVMHAQLAHPGNAAEPAAEALSTMTARFRPAVEGRKVELQAKAGNGWETVSTEVQDKHGVVEFAAPYRADGEVQTYRAVAAAEGDLPEQASPPAKTDELGAPDFTEEFDGNALASPWSHRLQGYSEPSGRECSKADPAAVQVADGVARLSAMVDPARAGETCPTDDGEFAYRLNGHISTEDQLTFTYGTFAARLKFQPLRGQHAAFWMQVADPLTGVGPPTETGAEIDVIEWFGEDHPQGGLTSFAYYRPDEDGEQVGGFIRKPEQYGDRWAQEYHVFSVEWTPDSYVFRIDGQETFRTEEGISGRPEFLILSLLSSDYELPYVDEGDLPQHMYVDWVRHWKQ